ncbi:hypothetical protein [Pedobacter nyackensis]|uniref:Uncharacterized protein n=1 Tax=Pedobacter nyackensis TaxID=475255 RepID=A0A1W1ZVA2_9SPHI|nr:hypothetical protein [Pedobacter nyackensis]SMC52405.1 hypothetical protein SAMN04488101_10182 [Pedobacter nyackensis]
MQVVKVKKSPSWTTILTEMEVEQEIPVELSKRNTISPLISRQLSLSHPHMGWTTEKLNDKVLMIKRIK